jgi:integrase
MTPFFGDDPIARVEQDDVEAFIARLRRSGLAPKTIRNVHGSLHTVFAYAVRRKKLARNVVSLVEPPAKMVSPDIHFLTLPDVQAVIRAVPPGEDWSAWEVALYATAAMTGMRMGELLGLQWGDVDWTAQKIRIRRAWVSNEMGAPKSRRSSRAVPMVGAVVAALDQLSKATHYGADDELVFGNVHTGLPPARSTVNNRLQARLSKAGVRRIRFHDLRHTYGTLMAASGVPMRTLQELMGHRNLETTLIYADYAPSGQELSWAEAAFKSAETGDCGQSTAGMPSGTSIEGLSRTTSSSGSTPSSTSPHGVP